MKTIGNIDQDGEIRAIASGALATGDTVIVNSDGTVSVVAGSNSSVGSPTSFNGNLSWISATFDSTANKVVVAYQDRANSFYGTALVGTVSGTSISFGSKTVFESAQTEEISAVYDAANNKTVIAYKDSGNSDYGTAIVGTVSGTSISFGSATVFESANTTNISAVYNSTGSKIVIAYQDATNSGYGTAIVGTVSGTAISFGSAAVFITATATGVSACYDSNSNKVITSYRNSGDSNAYAVVCTVSGTSISFGTPVSFASNGEDTKGVFDSGNNKIVIAYKDGGNSDYGTAIVGTVSGTAISFGTPAVFLSRSISGIGITFDSDSGGVVISYVDSGPSSNSIGSGDPTLVTASVSGTSVTFGSPTVAATIYSNWTAPTFDSNANKVVIAYTGYSGSYSGYGAVFKDGFTNLTSENFVGFANSGYADGQSAALNSTCSVDKNQSGLTAGETYYVQTDGTLGTTPASPSVLAGTAISSNSIIVKG